MLLKPIAKAFKSPWALKLVTKMSASMNSITSLKYRAEFEKNREIYEAKERRVLDAIFMQKEPDRVPVTTGGLNFFPPKYAGITCADYMFDHKKMKAAYIKTITDFDFDMTFPSSLLSFGRLMTASQFNLIKIPGRDITVNSGYQYNEYDRLKTEEYDEFLERGLDFLIDTMVPRISGIYKMKKIKRPAYTGRIFLELLGWLGTAIQILAEEKAMGQYNLMTSIAVSPFDIMSFMFRDFNSLIRDMMKKESKVQLAELLNKMEPRLTPLLSALPKFFGYNGIFFPSERAFSLSPRQFEEFYWPTLKKMIISFVKAGNIPFLVWESDVTHIIHFLLELPTSISRRCCLMVDQSDIFEVNRILDGHMAIQGNVPLSTMCVGTPKDVEKYCEKMFAELKPGGGFINCAALGIPDEAKPENVHALINYTQKYGKYI